jgi:RHH-type proline utilization regulon transcriptional repressor/proline dehydrogenase/delta 1-pyrroline-5-carboxylate dehydrogenase
MINILEVKLAESDWKLCGEDNYLYYINQEFGLLDQVVDFCHTNNKVDGFRWLVEIRSIQFLIGIFPEIKTIRLCSKNMAKEITLLNNMDRSHPSYKSLEDHCISISGLKIESSPSIIEFNSSKFKLPLFIEGEFNIVHEKTQTKMRGLVEDIKKYKQSPLEMITDYGLNLTANFMLIRIHVLKYLAILPNLSHDQEGTEVKRLLIETLRRLVLDSKKAKRKKYKGQKRSLPKNLETLFVLILKIVEIFPVKFLA